MNPLVKYVPHLIAAILLFGAGFWTADRLNKGSIVPPTHRDAVTHKDGTVEVERAPAAKPSLPSPKRPKGTKPVGTVEVTVSGGKPVPRETHTVTPATRCLTAEDFACPDVSVRMDLVTEPDGQMVVLLKPQRGHEIIEALHIPSTVVSMARNKRVTVVAGDDAIIGTYTKDYGRWSAGVAVWDVSGQRGAGLAGSFSW